MAPIILITGATGFIGFRVLVTTLSAGHTVRCTVRSDAKAKIISSNPAIEKLSPGSRLSFTIVPDMSASGAMDAALKDVTYVLHVGSPVPIPGYDPVTQVYEPTIKGISNLLASALHTPTLKRIIITSSIVSSLSPTSPPPPKTTASTRIPPPNPCPPTTGFTNVFEAYQFAKIVSMAATDTFLQDHPDLHFSLAHIIPGYVFGRNELICDAEQMLTANSSNILLMEALTGATVPAPILGGAAHVDDVADVHLRTLFLPESEPGADAQLLSKDFAVTIPVKYADAFEFVAKRYPKAVEEGVFLRGSMETMPMGYDASETERVLGIRFREFEDAVYEVAEQYLELLGKERA